MNRENRLLVTDVPVEFEFEFKSKDFKKITHQFRGIYRILYPNFMKGNRKVSTCNLLDLEKIRIPTDYAQKSPWTLGVGVD